MCGLARSGNSTFASMSTITITLANFDPETFIPDFKKPWSTGWSESRHEFEAEWTDEFSSDMKPKSLPQRLSHTTWNAVRIIGPNNGVSLDAPFLKSFLRYLTKERRDHLRGFAIHNILINTAAQVEWLEEVLLEHRKTLNVIVIGGDCSFAENVFCDELYFAVQRLHYPQIVVLFNLRMSTSQVTHRKFLRDKRATFEGYVQWVRNIAHLPSTIFLYSNKLFNYARRYVCLRDDVLPAMRKAFLDFLLAFAHTDVSCVAIFRIFAHLFSPQVKSAYDLVEAVPADADLVQVVYDWELPWKAKVLKSIRTRSGTTEYFCRHCRVPLCRIEQPLTCTCNRATFCCKACQKQHRKDTACKDSTYKAECCARERSFAFVFCKECIPSNYHYCSIDNTLVCEKCYFGSCPRLCGQTFSKERWAMQGKQHRSCQVLCFNSECSTPLFFTCALTQSIYGARKNILLCDHCRHLEKFRNPLLDCD